RLEATLDPQSVLPTIVETTAQALKLSYAAITLRHEQGFISAATFGAPRGETLTLPLVYRGEQVGQFILAARGTGASFTPPDRRLLDELARQAGIVVHAVLLTADLQRSNASLQAARERLVTAREEERRRLRRDLHDGLGPVLGGLTLKLDIARGLVDRDPARAVALLGDLKNQSQTAVADIRRLVYQLRPPALDELGLAGALRETAAQFGNTDGRMSIIIDVPRLLPPLPAAVEVAAYRIVQEALTNVVRHAEARNCTIHIACDDEARILFVGIGDDGIGLPDARLGGIGLTSIRERAAELGGTCAIERSPGGGTLVRARLPYEAQDESLDGTEQFTVTGIPLGIPG
nr:GAF domain-containing sensor histidine kinase [Chloroflexia bacterium]